jgi:hypothetical protein
MCVTVWALTGCLPDRCRLVPACLLPSVQCGHGVPRLRLSRDGAEYCGRSLSIGQMTVVVAVELLIKAGEQRERFSTDIRGVSGALQEAPVVLQAIWVRSSRACVYGAWPAPVFHASTCAPPTRSN